MEQIFGQIGYCTWLRVSNPTYYPLELRQRLIYDIFSLSHSGQTYILPILSQPKPSKKMGQQSAIYWNSLGLCRDYGLKVAFFQKVRFNFQISKSQKIYIPKNYPKLEI